LYKIITTRTITDAVFIIHAVTLVSLHFRHYKWFCLQMCASTRGWRWSGEEVSTKVLFVSKAVSVACRVIGLVSHLFNQVGNCQFVQSWALQKC